MSLGGEERFHLVNLHQFDAGCVMDYTTLFQEFQMIEIIFKGNFLFSLNYFNCHLYITAQNVRQKKNAIHVVNTRMHTEHTAQTLHIGLDLVSSWPEGKVIYSTGCLGLQS